MRPALAGCMRIGVVFFVGIVISASVARAQKQEISQGEIKQSSYAALAEAPEKARERANPMAGDPEAAAVGKKLFEQHCAECHGKAAEGAKKGPSLVREEVQQATPGTLFWILTNGVVRRGMPVWSKLPEPQRWQIVTFLKSLKPAAAKMESN
jgi:mono/diheme cytochrome c family protein